MFPNSQQIFIVGIQEWEVELLGILKIVLFSSVQLLTHIQLFVIPWMAAHQASLSITNSWSLLKLTSIELVMPSNYLILCCPSFLPPSIFLGIRVFPNESVLCIRWPNYWSFSFSISPSNEYSGLISFRTDWFDLLAVQEILKSLFQHHSSKASKWKEMKGKWIRKKEMKLFVCRWHDWLWRKSDRASKKSHKLL